MAKPSIEGAIWKTSCLWYVRFPNIVSVHSWGQLAVVSFRHSITVWPVSLQISLQNVEPCSIVLNCSKQVIKVVSSSTQARVPYMTHAGSKIQMANLPISNIPKQSIVIQCCSDQSVLLSTAIRLDAHYVTDDLMLDTCILNQFLYTLPT